MDTIVQFGDLIQYLRIGNGVYEQGYCIGAVRYADNVLLIATEDVSGMLIDADRCSVSSTGHHIVCATIARAIRSALPRAVETYM